MTNEPTHPDGKPFGYYTTDHHAHCSEVQSWASAGPCNCSKPEAMREEIEEAAKAIYLGLYGSVGGRWELVETKDVWYEKARRKLELNANDEQTGSCKPHC